MTNQQFDQNLLHENFTLPQLFEKGQFFKISFYLGAFFSLLGVIIMYFTPPFKGFIVSGHPIFYMISEAFMAFTCFAIAGVSSLLFLTTKKFVYDVITVSAVKVGILASILTLLIGIFWSKAEWGQYWQWEPRQTMTLIMLLFYCGLLIFRSTVDDLLDKAKLSAVFGIAAFPTVPMTYFIVGALHPKNVLSGGNIETFAFIGVILLFIGTFFIYFCLFSLTLEHERMFLDLEQKKFILMANQE